MKKILFSFLLIPAFLQAQKHNVKALFGLDYAYSTQKYNTIGAEFGLTYDKYKVEPFIVAGARMSVTQELPGQYGNLSVGAKYKFISISAGYSLGFDLKKIDRKIQPNGDTIVLSDGVANGPFFTPTAKIQFYVYEAWNIGVEYRSNPQFGNILFFSGGVKMPIILRRNLQ